MKLFTIILATLVTTLPQVLFAQEVLSNPLVFTSFEGILLAFVRVITILAIPVVVFFVIYSGFLYVTAQGDPEKIRTASKSLLYALIGGVIIIGATAITEIVRSTVTEFNQGGGAYNTEQILDVLA